MKKILSTVMALIVAMSFTVVGYADAKTKSPKKAKQEAEVAKYEAKTARYAAKAAESNAIRRNADRKK